MPLTFRPLFLTFNCTFITNRCLCEDCTVPYTKINIFLREVARPKEDDDEPTKLGSAVSISNRIVSATSSTTPGPNPSLDQLFLFPQNNNIILKLLGWLGPFRCASSVSNKLGVVPNLHLVVYKWILLTASPNFASYVFASWRPRLEISIVSQFVLSLLPDRPVFILKRLFWWNSFNFGHLSKFNQAGRAPENTAIWATLQTKPLHNGPSCTR